MTQSNLPPVPRVTLGRSGIVSTRLSLGCANWPFQVSYEQVVEMFHTAFAVGIRHIDVAAVYNTEELVGRALKDAGAPPDMVLATKGCSYRDDLGVEYRSYTQDTAYRTVERSLKRLQVDRVAIFHLHDCEPPDLPQVFARDGALRALLDLKHQGVIGSIGMATWDLDCLQAAIDCGGIDHIQAFHTYTLLNQQASRKLFPAARAAKLGVMNAAPLAGYILASGAVPGAKYNYKPAEPRVVEAVRRMEEICARKGVSLSAAALAFSLWAPEIDVTIVAPISPEQLRDCVRAFEAPLTVADLEELVVAARGPFPISSPYKSP